MSTITQEEWEATGSQAAEAGRDLQPIPSGILDDISLLRLYRLGLDMARNDMHAFERDTLERVDAAEWHALERLTVEVTRLINRYDVPSAMLDSTLDKPRAGTTSRSQTV